MEGLMRNTRMYIMRIFLDLALVEQPSRVVRLVRVARR